MFLGPAGQHGLNQARSLGLRCRSESPIRELRSMPSQHIGDAIRLAAQRREYRCHTDSDPRDRRAVPMIEGTRSARSRPVVESIKNCLQPSQRPWRFLGHLSPSGRPQLAAQNSLRLSISSVVGPSLTSSTSMCSWKRPVATAMPRPRTSATKA